MSRIPLSAIRNRSINLKTENKSSPNVNIQNIYENNLKKYNLSNTVAIVENWNCLNPNIDMAIIQIMEAFDIVCENGSKSDIRKISNIITESIIPKVRDAVQLQASLKRKMSRVKTKINTKINNKIEDMENAVTNTLPPSIQTPVTTTQPSGNTIKECLTKMIEATNVCVQSDRVLLNHSRLSKRYNIDSYIRESITTPETISNCVMELCTLIDTYKMPFKVKYNVALENILYALNKNGIVYENKNLINDVTNYFLATQPIYESGKLNNAIETLNNFKDPKIKKLITLIKDMEANDYEMTKVEKVIIAISSIIVLGSVPGVVLTSLLLIIFTLPMIIPAVVITGIYAHRIKEVKKAISECDNEEDKKNMETYLKTLTSQCNTPIKKESYIVRDIKIVMENNKFFDGIDLEEIEYIISKNEDKDMPFANTFDANNTYNVNDVSSLDESTKSHISNILEGAKSNKAKDIFQSFKLSQIKTPEALKAMIRKLYTCDADNIIQETPNLIQWMFMMGVTVGAIAINPIIAVMVAFTNGFISMQLQKKETLKMISIYKKQRNNAKAKLENIKNEESKTKCKAFIKQLDSDISKLESYYDDLLSEREKEEIREKESKNNNEDDYNFNEGFTDDIKDIGIGIVAIANSIDDIISKWNSKGVIEDIDYNIDRIGLDDLDSLTEFALTNYDVLPVKRLLSIYENNLIETRKRNDIKRYIRIDCLNENISKLKNVNEKSILESINIYNEMYDISNYMKAITEVMCKCKESQSVVLEMDFTNTIKLMIEKLKKSTVNLSDKEKLMSRTLDGSMETLKDNMEKAITNENRESVIRGSIIPSASRCVKLAITSGLAWMISPAIAVIGLLGSFAMANKIKTKERQLILDELDVELVMVEKYLKIAEEKNDMKAMRELLMIQKKLTVQKSRLSYKMKFEWNQKTPGTTKDRDE